MRAPAHRSQTAAQARLYRAWRPEQTRSPCDTRAPHNRDDGREVSHGYKKRNQDYSRVNPAGYGIPVAIVVEDERDSNRSAQQQQREIEVLRRVAAGNSNKLIAVELDISEGTVKTHMKSILPKLAAADRTHAVTIALKCGILDL